jgi:hypothetical protein
MTSCRSNQLELALQAVPASFCPRGVVVTRALRKHRSCNRTLEKVLYALRYFPEFDENQIKVGLTRAASGMAVPGGFEIWLNPFRVSYHTIAHELVHLLQSDGGRVPQGERSCDLFALARHWTLNDVVPSYVKIPARLIATDGTLPPATARAVYETAVESLERRRDGLRHYIAWFEDRMRALASQSHRTGFER